MPVIGFLTVSRGMTRMSQSSGAAVAVVPVGCGAAVGCSMFRRVPSLRLAVKEYDTAIVGLYDLPVTLVKSDAHPR